VSTTTNTLVQPRAGERPTLTACLTRSVSLSDATKHLELEVEGLDVFDFAPGQFVSIKQRKPDGKEHTRAYSIASAPHGATRFSSRLGQVLRPSAE
jgi:ferredoxin-NADP reductase